MLSETKGRIKKMTLAKVNGIYQKSCTVVQRAVYSDVFLACVCLFTYLVWLLNWSMFGVAVIFSLACLTLLFSDCLSVIFLPIVCVMTAVRTEDATSLVSLWPLLILFVLCAGCFVWRNFSQKLRLGQMFFPYLAVTVSLLLGGIGVISAENYLRALPLVLGVGAAPLAIYFVFVNFLRQENSADIPLYFAKVCAFAGFVVCLELVTVMAQSGLSPSQWGGSYWHVGWGNRGTIAEFLPFSFVMCLYLATRAKRCSYVYLLAAFVQVFCLALTMSRSGILFGGIAFAVGWVMCILKGNRKELLICSGIIAGLVILFCIVFHQKVGSLISGILQRFGEFGIRFENGKLVIDGTSGRWGEDGLYGKAIRMFKDYPVFGAGLGHGAVGEGPNMDIMERFHSTVLEVMASLGIVGMLCYGFYYVVRFATVFRKGNIKNKFPLFVFIVWIAFEGHSLVDMNTFAPVFVIFVSLQLAIIQVCKGERYEEKTQILWLYPQFNKSALPKQSEDSVDIVEESTQI